MVKISIAGASGEVAREVIDGLVEAKKHEILLLSRKDVSAMPTIPSASWIQADYADKEQLTKVLRGTHTVLSFITPQTDPGSLAQKNLIDASILAGVERFAPSEWATSSFEHMNWYAGKAEIREYLKDLNKNRKVLEYTLFQPGLFLNYITHPYKSATHLNTFQTQFDFQNLRAIVPKGCDDTKITLTTVQDLVSIVVQAVEYQGEWPMTGGIKGCELSIAQLIQIGEDICGGPFSVERLKLEDLKAGIVKSSWIPKVSHAAIPPDQAEALAGMFLAGMTLGISAGALNVSDEWNRLLPDYKFTQPHQFLLEAWQGQHLTLLDILRV